MWFLFSTIGPITFIFFIISFPFIWIISFQWVLTSSSLNLTRRVLKDYKTTLFLSTVLLIYLRVLVFSYYYIKAYSSKFRFYTLTFLFVLSMTTLIVFPHPYFLIVGWDGLGLTSFLLIIYFKSHKRVASATLTFITNRLGDSLLLPAISLIIYVTNTRSPPSSSLTSIQLLLVVRCITKRAQFPFISWLPAAIAAPTPISALVHSSTLVTAGIFVLLRFFPSIHTKDLFYIIGGFTMIIAAICNLLSFDAKKIIALSTLRNLGLMFSALCLSSSHLSFSHMCSHAFFKALLFILVGLMIVTHDHQQDIRRISSSNTWAGLTLSAAIIVLLGWPIISAFIRKELILEQIYFKHNILLISIYIFIVLTIIYSSRLLGYVILNIRLLPPLSCALPVPVSSLILLGLLITPTGLMIYQFLSLRGLMTPSPYKYFPLTLIVLAAFFVVPFSATPILSSLFFTSSLNVYFSIFPSRFSIRGWLVTDTVWNIFFISYKHQTFPSQPSIYPRLTLPASITLLIIIVI